ncbi:hypothetical protein D9M71_247350 [compost metagenome]
MFCSAFFVALHLSSNATLQSDSKPLVEALIGAGLVQSVDFDTQSHVIAALGGIVAGLTIESGLALLIGCGQSDPLAQPAADFAVGALHVDYILAVAVQAVVVGADVQVHGVARDAGGDVEALGDVAVLGLALQVAVEVGLGSGQRYALAHLDQCRRAFAGLDLLQAAAAVAGAVANDAGAVALFVLVVAVAGVDTDQQASRAGIKLFDQGANFRDLAWILGLYHELVAVGADTAVLAEKVLRSGEEVVTGAVIQCDDFGGGDSRDAEGQEEGGKQGAWRHVHYLREGDNHYGAIELDM